ncbi:MAG: MarR family transcriptional regulator [Candidatus Competibacteraceae bacterium]|nr:MAG: MarR family transcriptional regulator [Candidatus Competibacteraceae bacterium]
MASTTPPSSSDTATLTDHDDETELYTIENWTMDESLGYLLSLVRGRIVASIETESAALGITWAQWGTLLKIANGKAETASDLCRYAACDTGSMTRMLDRLEQKGFLRRERSAEDRRVVHLRLTEAGQALYPQLPPIAVKVLNRYLRGFNRQELEELKSYLRRMLANADHG